MVSIVFLDPICLLKQSKNFLAGYTVTMKEDPEYHPIQDFHIKGTEEFEDSMNTGETGERGSIVNIIYGL